MTNKDFAERFEQTRGVQIEKLFWIAGSVDNYELNDLIEELEDQHWEKLFPDIFNDEQFEGSIVKGVDALIEFGKFGLIAEIHIAMLCYFSYNEDDTKVFASYSRGCCRIEYAYAETLEELMIEIEKISEEIFREEVQKDRKKKELPPFKFEPLSP